MVKLANRATMFLKIVSGDGTLRNASHSSSLLAAHNSGYEAVAFGFHPNPSFARTSHIPNSYAPSLEQEVIKDEGLERWHNC
jgi:hypothetical protein